MSRNEEGGEKRDIWAGEEPAGRGVQDRRPRPAGAMCQSPECRAKAGVHQHLLSYRFFALGQPVGKAAGTRC